MCGDVLLDVAVEPLASSEDTRVKRTAIGLRDILPGYGCAHLRRQPQVLSLVG